MKTKTILSVLALGLAAGVSASLAQEAAPPPPADQPPAGDQPPPPPHRPGRRDMLKRLQQELNLTEAQTAQVKEILAKHRQAMEALRNDDSLTDDAQHEKAKALVQSSRDQIRALLTPEQQKTFDATPAFPPRPPAPPPGQ